MSAKELQQRVAALERQVKQFQEERAIAENGRRFNWEATVDKFRGDEDILAVLKEVMKLREKDRRAVRREAAKTRRAKP